MPTAFVSGATGFIAQHLVQLLLTKNFTVIGSVRSEQKGENLKKLFGTPDFSYAVVKDLSKPGAFDEALKANPEINVFFHTASPASFPESGDFEELIFNPAVEGTKSALKAVKCYGKNVKKFILTSSAGAIAFSQTPPPVITEDTWTEIAKDDALGNSMLAYIASKTYGEKAAWDFIEEEDPQFTLTTVNPAYVFGPQAFDSEVKGTLNYSAEVINRFLKLKDTDDYPADIGSWYDVRDVAKTHLVAYESNKAVGKRLFLENGKFSPQLIANVLHKHFPELTNIPIGNPDTVEEALNEGTPIDSSKTAKILEFKPIDFEKSVVDTVNQILGSK